MNIRLVINQLGVLLAGLAGAFLVIAGFSILQWAVFDGGASERAATKALLCSTVIGALIGGTAWATTRRCERRLGRREALLLVGLTWLVGGALAALPFRLWSAFDATIPADQPFHGFVDCYFESISGLTTTGATVLSSIGELPPSILLWRSLTHWLGGLGIVVLFVAVLPSLGTGGKRLFRVEAPGPRHEGVRPQIREASRLLWRIYLGLTTVCFLGYWAFGMPWFDAMCHAFSTLSTGGLSTQDASIGHFGSLGVELVCILFMIAAGVNFTIYDHMRHGRWKAIWSDVELRVYLIMKIMVFLIVVPDMLLNLDAIVRTNGETVPATTGEVMRHGAFAVAALQTGTGFGTADFGTGVYGAPGSNYWPTLSNLLLIGVMIVGGCAGSTAGGIKVVRFWMAIRIMAAELEKAFRPDVVRPLKVGGSTIDADMKLAVVTFVLGFVGVFAIGAGAIVLLEGPDRCDFLTACTASLATLGNVGPGLGRIGPVGNYGWMTDGSKLLMTLLMVLGRLEFFAIVVLFTPRFWRGD